MRRNTTKRAMGSDGRMPHLLAGSMEAGGIIEAGPLTQLALNWNGGSNHVWLVRRKDTNQLATMGGFVQVGETLETAVKRELMEEMGIALVEPPILFGVYSDPRRDNRRHTVSATYAIQVDENVQPVAADDAKEVHRIALDDIELHSFFADHKTILTDFRSYLRRETLRRGNEVGDFANDIARSICLVDNRVQRTRDPKPSFLPLRSYDESLKTDLAS
eukprot:scaffold1129_cov164-Amphora_coffeaeformis.AAC.3